jgi:hypothetical protein
MSAVELETVHWDRVDNVFEEGVTSVPHYNYRIQSRGDTLGSSNLEVFVEEEVDVPVDGVLSRSSAASAEQGEELGEEVDGRTRSSAGSTSSTGPKYGEYTSQCEWGLYEN